MPRSADPTLAIRTEAAKLPDVVEGTSCNQTSFKVGKSSFFFVGPGAKGIGFKAMFKLADGLEEARELAESEPDRFSAGSTGWVTVRFTAEKPLQKRIWSRWLKEAHKLASGGAKKPARKKSKR